jgi:hypothetical protein
MNNKVIGVLAGALVGWVVDQIATDVFEALGVPKRTATIAGGIIGGLL